jgi:hypothetical protein
MRRSETEAWPLARLCLYKFDHPEVLEQNPETGSVDSDQSLASAFTLARPILLVRRLGNGILM